MVSLVPITNAEESFAICTRYTKFPVHCTCDGHILLATVSAGFPKQTYCFRTLLMLRLSTASKRKLCSTPPKETDALRFVAANYFSKPQCRPFLLQHHLQVFLAVFT